MKIRKLDGLVSAISLLCLCNYFYHYFFVSNTAVYNFISYSAPAFVVINILAVLFCIIRKSVLTFIPLIALLFSVNVIKVSVGLKLFPEMNKSDVKILTYNVGTFDLDRFNMPDTLILKDTVVQHAQKRFIKMFSADIICLQEFYNYDGHESESMLNDMSELGYKYYYTNPIRIQGYKGYFGVINFSKYPIVSKGQIEFPNMDDNRLLNRGIYTDIVVGNDTVRIINIHLYSMHIRIKELGDSSSQTMMDQFDLIREKMDRGFNKRGKQIEYIEKYIQDSPYKVILCGDLNDMPYSYTYSRLKKSLNNTFEDAGTGFGFTYNKFPWFIRIDNQFYDNRLGAEYCYVIKNNKNSDHFPVVAGYSFRRD